MPTLISKRSSLLSAFLLSPAIAFAHSGMMDRWIATMINLKATCCTVYAVQLIFGITALLLLMMNGNPITGLFRKGAAAIYKKAWVRLFAVWFLTAYVLTPYLAILDHSLFFLTGAILIIAGIFSILMVSIPVLRRWITKEKTICVMLHLSFSATVGYIVIF